MNCQYYQIRCLILEQLKIGFVILICMDHGYWYGDGDVQEILVLDEFKGSVLSSTVLRVVTRFVIH